jgi:hypothetical protein
MPMGKGKKNPQYMHTLSVCWRKKLEGKKKKNPAREKTSDKNYFSANTSKTIMVHSQPHSKG